MNDCILSGCFTILFSLKSVDSKTNMSLFLKATLTPKNPSVCSKPYKEPICRYHLKFFLKESEIKKKTKISDEIETETFLVSIPCK